MHLYYNLFCLHLLCFKKHLLYLNDIHLVNEVYFMLKVHTTILPT